MDIADLAEPPERPRKTALQKLSEDIQRQLAPLRQIQEMQALVKRYSPEFQMRELLQQFEPHREMQEMLARTAIPQHIRDIIDGTSIASQALRMAEQYLPRTTFSNLGTDNDAIRRAAGITLDNEALWRATGPNPVSAAAKQYEEYLKPIAQQQEWLEKLQRQAFEGFSATDFARQLEQANPVFRAVAEAKNSLDRLWPNFRDIDFSQFEADEDDEQEAKKAVVSITGAAVEQPTFQEAIDRIVSAIQAQQKPTVQLMLWLFFCKVVDWMISGAIGAAMGHYTPAVLGESPQAAKKSVQEAARVAVGSPELLTDYRYVSAKVLIVRQNAKALSPEIARLTFGKSVKLLKKEKDFALVLWTDKESGAEVQGWVFARYLGRFQ
jgi:hypothetical protein